MLAIHSETSDAHCRAVMHSSMPHRCAVHRISVWGNVLDLETYDIAAAQLAIDGQVKHAAFARGWIHEIQA
jgi:hypothetical protein